MTTTTGLRAEDILESLTRVIEPGYGINIVDLGLVYGIELAQGRATIQLATTAPSTSIPAQLVADIDGLLRRRHPELRGVDVQLADDPAWREDYITEAGLIQLRHPVRPGATDDAITAESARESLKLVLDPEVGINVVDLGLIYGVTVSGSDVAIEMTLTTPGCPLHESIEQAVRRVLETRHPGIGTIWLDFVWEPAWDVDRLTPEGRSELGWA